LIALIQRGILDTDDEVRDRATLALASMTSPAPPPPPPLPPLASLERSLRNYLATPAQSAQRRFNLADVPAEEPAPIVAAPAVATSLMSPATAASSAATPAAASTAAGAAASASDDSRHKEELAAIPALATLGAYFKSSRPVALTESESEFVVACIKHVLADHIVLQFNVTNTLKNMALAHVQMKLDLSGVGGLAPRLSIPITRVNADETKPTYVVPFGLFAPCLLTRLVQLHCSAATSRSPCDRLYWCQAGLQGRGGWRGGRRG
jgi:coatomer protein complex subunit gamma